MTDSKTLRLHAKVLALIPREDTARFLRDLAEELDHLRARLDVGFNHGPTDACERQMVDLQQDNLQLASIAEVLLAGNVGFDDDKHREILARIQGLRNRSDFTPAAARALDEVAKTLPLRKETAQAGCWSCEDVNDCIYNHDQEACGEMLTGLCARCSKPITADHHQFCEAGEDGRTGETKAFTPVPWRAIRGGVVADHETGWDDADNCRAYGGHLICESVRWPANADFIVRACNSYDVTLNALRDALGVFQLLGSGQKSPFSCSEMCERIGAAIAKAEGRTP